MQSMWIENNALDQKGRVEFRHAEPGLTLANSTWIGMVDLKWGIFDRTYRFPLQESRGEIKNAQYISGISQDDNVFF